MKVNNSKRKSIKFALFCLLITTVFFALGYRMGNIRERAANTAMYKLAMPAGIVTLISDGQIDRAQERVERHIDHAIWDAIHIRENSMLLSTDKKNLEKALKRALRYKSESGYYSFSLQNLRPTFRKKFLKVKEELIEHEPDRLDKDREVRRVNMDKELTDPTADNVLDMEFIQVEPGAFKMGSDSNKAFPDEQPVREVKISGAFWIGKYPVTQSEYEELMGKNPSHFEGADHPVEGVSWHDAVDFCEKLTGRERKADRLPEGYAYRLPTEAEWEYTALGGSKSRGYKYAGSNNIDEVAWYEGNSDGETRKVGQKKSNELGIYDMSGNVWEWCYDWYDSDYYEYSPREDPVNTSRGWSSFRVGRGGSWSDTAIQCRTANRALDGPDNTREVVGFRVVLAPAIQQ